MANQGDVVKRIIRRAQARMDAGITQELSELLQSGATVAEIKGWARDWDLLS